MISLPGVPKFLFPAFSNIDAPISRVWIEDTLDGSDGGSIFEKQPALGTGLNPSISFALLQRKVHN